MNRSLPLTYAWARKGEAVRVPRAWGKARRVNAVVRLEKGLLLGYPLLEGRCGTEEAAERWRTRGLEVAYPPRYSPHPNPVESVWWRVKGFRMPRRRYGGLEELKEAVVQALEALAGVELKILGKGT